MESATAAPPVPADEETPAGDPTNPLEAPATPPEPQDPPAEGETPAADLPDGEDHGDPDDVKIEMILGTNNQLSLKVGGEKPTASEFKVVGGAVAVEGEFKKGDIVTAEVQLRVGEITFADKVDVDGNVTATTRRHKARIESIQRIES